MKHALKQSVKHSSQIVTQPDKVIILLASPLKLFIKKYLILIYLIPILIFIIVSIILSNPLIALLAFVFVPILSGVNYLLKSDIIITKEFIKDDNHKVILQRIPYLDIQVKAHPDKIKIRIDKITFELKNATDLPILIDIISEKTDLAFYDNHQLSDKSDVITYKSKHLTKPVFSTFLTVQNQQDKIRIYDMTSNRQYTWFEVKKTQATIIQYSKSAGDDYVLDTINLNNIEQIQVIIDNKASASGQYRRLSVVALERKQAKKGIAKLQTRFYNDNSPYHKHYFFYANLRRAKDELTNFRDGEKIYDLLKTLPSLANIEIKKIIINT